LSEEAVRLITQKSADLPKLGKPAAEHATDFDPPIYNIWKQQTKNTRRSLRRNDRNAVKAELCLWKHFHKQTASHATRLASALEVNWRDVHFQNGTEVMV
tara:strand:- start:823 stop:1122 length:300 start_codon:yes stop_codon:yes gene_type:complete